MKCLLLILLLISGTLQASDGKPIYHLTIVDEATFSANDFWETPAGQAFWKTPEGKTVLKTMLDYQTKMEHTKK